MRGPTKFELVAELAKSEARWKNAAMLLHRAARQLDFIGGVSLAKTINEWLESQGWEHSVLRDDDE